MPLPSHLFVASNGALYDTRADGWSKAPPLRADYRRGQNWIENCAELKSALRYGETTDLGGYPLYFITSDGAALSFEAVRAELSQVMRSIQDRSSDGWRVVACEVNYEDSDLHCDHTGKRIPSAYAEE